MVASKPRSRAPDGVFLIRADRTSIGSSLGTVDNWAPRNIASAFPDRIESGISDVGIGGDRPWARWVFSTSRPVSFLRTSIPEIGTPVAGRSVNGFRLNCALHGWSFAESGDRRQSVSERRLRVRRLERHWSSQISAGASTSTRRDAHIDDASLCLLKIPSACKRR